jgi:hypothetical protein
MFCCKECRKKHEKHTIKNIAEDLDMKKSTLEDLIREIDSKQIDTNYEVIKSMKNVFENDFLQEEKRIREQFEIIRKKIDDLEKMQIEKLRNSREEFLNEKFGKIFNESEKAEYYYNSYLKSKQQCNLFLK